MKPKEYLLGKGLIKEVGRGRLSLAHIAVIEEAVQSGVFIEGYSKSTAAVAATPKSSPEKTPIVGERMLDVPDEARREEDWQAFTSNGEVGMRTVCNICHSSLTYCHCAHPKVWIDFRTEGVVFFKTRKPRK